MTMGRPRTFEGPTTKVSVVVPSETARLRAFPDSGRMVASKAELKARIMRYLLDLNADPVVFRWRYKVEEESVS
jgi:hypothetical protein